MLNICHMYSEEARSPANVKVSNIRTERYESAAEGFTTGDETENDEVPLSLNILKIHHLYCPLFFKLCPHIRPRQ